MILWVKVLADKPKDLSSILKTYTVKGENKLTPVVQDQPTTNTKACAPLPCAYINNVIRRNTLAGCLVLCSMLHTPQLYTYIVDHEVHDGLGHEIPYSLVDNGHVRVYQVPDGLHLALQLRVHGVHEAVRAVLLGLTGLPLGTQASVWEGCLCNQSPGITETADLARVPATLKC